LQYNTAQFIQRHRFRKITRFWDHAEACVRDAELQTDNVDEVQQRLVDVWSGLLQSIVDVAVSE